MATCTTRGKKNKRAAATSLQSHLDNADAEHLPGGEEQHRLANFLAREEENRPGGGWDEGEELDYAQIAASFGGMLQLENEGEREGINIPTQPNGNIRPSLRKYEQVDEVFDFDEAILEERDGVLQHSRLPSHKSMCYLLHKINIICNQNLK